MKGQRRGTRLNNRQDPDEDEDEALERKYTYDRRGSLFSAARSSTLSTSSYKSLSPAEKLLYTLYRHFPAQDIKELENRALEIQHFLQVDQIKAFTNMARIKVNELLMARRMANTKTINGALESLRREVIIIPGSRRGRKQSSVVKSCLRQSGETKAQSPGERLAERLGDLLDADVCDFVIYRSDTVSSKDDLEELIVYLGEMLTAKVDAAETTARTEVTEALTYFSKDIIAKERERREIRSFMESMRSIVQLILKDMSLEQDAKTKIFDLCQDLEADYNSIMEDDENEEHFKHRMLVRSLSRMVATLEAILPQLPPNVTPKVREFIDKANSARKRLSFQ